MYYQQKSLFVNGTDGYYIYRVPALVRFNNGEVLHAGPVAYSDLCLDTERRICCFYKQGEAEPYETISFDQFDLDWLAGGEDRLQP